MISYYMIRRILIKQEARKESLIIKAKRKVAFNESHENNFIFRDLGTQVNEAIEHVTFVM